MNRFDIIHAHYVYYTRYHGGQGSREYARLCRILGYYRPVTDDLENEEQRAIYVDLVQRNGHELYCGFRCAHSACTQNYIDTGDASCVNDE